MFFQSGKQADSVHIGNSDVAAHSDRLVPIDEAGADLNPEWAVLVRLVSAEQRASPERSRPFLR